MPVHTQSPWILITLGDNALTAIKFLGFATVVIFVGLVVTQNLYEGIAVAAVGIGAMILVFITAKRLTVEEVRERDHQHLKRAIARRKAQEEKRLRSLS
jgi:hypothetical protein